MRTLENTNGVSMDYDPLMLSHLHYVVPQPHERISEIVIPRRGDREIKLELYIPEGIAKETKSIIFFPGCMIQGYEMVNVAEKFLEKGYVVWVVNFSVGDTEKHSFCNYTISQLVKDVKDTINFVYAHTLVDKKNLYLAGHSFGAFSSLLYLARHKDPRIRAAIAICPVIDVVEVGLNHIRQIIHNMHHAERLLRVWVWKSRRFLKNMVFFFWKVFGKFLFMIRNGDKVFLSRKFLEDIILHNSKDKVLKELSKIKTPLLFLHAEFDQWVRVENVIKLYGRITSGLKKVFVLKGVNHLPLGAKGADQIAEKAIPWLESFCASAIPEPAIISSDN
jgi:pimeloyl-ACP methyl ester carboxylesterase